MTDRNPSTTGAPRGATTDRPRCAAPGPRRARRPCSDRTAPPPRARGDAACPAGVRPAPLPTKGGPHAP